MSENYILCQQQQDIVSVLTITRQLYKTTTVSYKPNFHCSYHQDHS